MYLSWRLLGEKGKGGEREIPPPPTNGRGGINGILDTCLSSFNQLASCHLCWHSGNPSVRSFGSSLLSLPPLPWESGRQACLLLLPIPLCMKWKQTPTPSLPRLFLPSPADSRGDGGGALLPLCTTTQNTAGRGETACLLHYLYGCVLLALLLTLTLHSSKPPPPPSPTSIPPAWRAGGLFAILGERKGAVQGRRNKSAQSLKESHGQNLV